MSNTYTNLDNLSLGLNGADVVTLSSAGLSVTTVSGSNVTASGYVATTIGAATPAASITALPSSKSFYRMLSTIAVGLKGIVAGTDGQQLDIYFKSASNLTITAESTAVATVANRITIMTTAATIATTAGGFASLIYSATDSRWLLKYLTT